MVYMKWPESLDTGVALIDQQHRRIVDQINSLSAARDEDDGDKVLATLAALSEYTAVHFAVEEALMEQCAYPYLKAHRRIHELFTRKLREFVGQARDGEDVGAELLFMLRRWIINHVGNDDADYAPAARRMLREQAAHAEAAARPGRHVRPALQAAG